LKLVDAAGVDVAPVIDTSEGTRRFVRVLFKVEGRPALVEAYADFFRSNDIPAIYYETADCTGRAFIRNAFGDPLVVPVAAVTGVAGEQLLHVADGGAVGEVITVRAFRENLSRDCRAETSSYSSIHAFPVVATLDLTAVGSPPYRVVWAVD
jgi:hypothetical protein